MWKVVPRLAVVASSKIFWAALRNRMFFSSVMLHHALYEVLTVFFFADLGTSEAR